MRKKPTEQLVFETLFPRPKPGDPHDFHTFLERHLVVEVRQEVHAFYGHIDDLESKYPGLDYTHRTHRLRLSRWQWHRRLFRAFDSLGLTDAEIHGLTKWEGTKWAKERYERDQGITIRDTATDYIGVWVPPERRDNTALPSTNGESEQRARPEDSDDEVESSVGVELNERLVQRAAAHMAGDRSQPLDEEWEQWLKSALEAGEFPLVEAELSSRRSGNRPPNVNLAQLVPQHMLAAATAGRWNEVPIILRDMLRRDMQRAGYGHPEPSPVEPASENSSSNGRRADGPTGSSNSSRRPVPPTARTEHQSMADPVRAPPPTVQLDRGTTPIIYGVRPGVVSSRSYRVATSRSMTNESDTSAAPPMASTAASTAAAAAAVENAAIRRAENDRIFAQLTERGSITPSNLAERWSNSEFSRNLAVAARSLPNSSHGLSATPPSGPARLSDLVLDSVPADSPSTVTGSGADIFTRDTPQSSSLRTAASQRVRVATTSSTSDLLPTITTGDSNGRTAVYSSRLGPSSGRLSNNNRGEYISFHDSSAQTLDSRDDLRYGHEDYQVLYGTTLLNRTSNLSLEGAPSDLTRRYHERRAVSAARQTSTRRPSVRGETPSSGEPGR